MIANEGVDIPRHEFLTSPRALNPQEKACSSLGGIQSQSVVSGESKNLFSLLGIES
jgi:hypothetical protein